MPLSIEQITERLVESRLMSADEISSCQSRLPTGQSPPDGDDLKQLLLQEGKLTAYQASAIEAGNTKGLVLGIYSILERIGSGSTGDVYKAEHQLMERLVAIKVLPDQLLESDEALQRFQRETTASAKLEHPNIVRAHDADEDDGVHFLVMQYVEGQNLQRMVDLNGPLPIDQAIDCALQTAQGLEHAHQVGVLHRNIKPGNLVLDDQGIIKILDMGVARLVSDGDTVGNQQELTQTGTIVGAVDFLSPEQAEDPRSSDHRNDIYSLGCTFFALLTGRVLYPGGSTLDKIVAHRDHPIPSLCESRPDATPELNAIFQKMVAKDPADRYQSATEVIAALRSLLPASDSDEPYAVLAQQDSPPASGPLPQEIDETVPRFLVPRVKTVRPRKRVREPRRRESAPSQRAIRLKKLPVLLVLGCVGLLVILVASSVFFRTRDGSPRLPTDAAGIVSLPPLAQEPFGREQARNLRRQWAAYLKDVPSFVNGKGMKLVMIPPGQYTMGSSDDEVRWWSEHGTTLAPWFPDSVRREAPAHSVTINRPFYMAVHEVTVGRFRAFVEATDHQTSAELGGGGRALSGGRFVQQPNVNWRDAGFEQAGDHPVVQVSWSDAEKFCAWLSEQEGKKYRLPTEAEWEYACRAGTTTRWYTGNEEATIRRDANCGNVLPAEGDPDEGTSQGVVKPRFPHTAPVGQFAANNFGLFDMHGNVREYCCDWYQPDYYQRAASFNTPGPDWGDGRVARGGAWCDDPAFLRSANRNNYEPNYGSHLLGFRVVCEIPFTPPPPTRGGDEILVSLTERQELRGHTGSWVGKPSFSPDGRFLATPGWDTTIRLWDVASARKERSLLGHTLPVGQALFAPVGMLASRDDDKVIKLWDPTNGHNFANLSNIPTFNISFSRDARLLACAGDTGLVRLWDLTRYSSRDLVGHEVPARCVSFSPDGLTLASGGDDATVRLWDTQTHEILAVLDEPPAEVLALDFSPGGDLLAAGCQDGTIQLWDVKAKSHVGTLWDWDKGALRHLRFAPGGRVLASAGPGPRVTLWEMKERQVLVKIPTNGNARGVAFSNDGNWMAVTSDTKDVTLWELAWAKVVPADGVAVQRAVSEPPLTSLPPVADIPVPKSVSISPRPTPVRHRTALSPMALVPQPAAAEGLQAWSVETRSHRGRVSAIAASPDGQHVALGGRDASIRIWATTNRELKQILLGHAGEVISLSWSRDGRYLASGGRDATARIWEMPSGRLLCTRRNPVGLPIEVRWSPDGAILWYADPFKLWLWDPEAEGEIVLIGRHKGKICWDRSWDGKLLVTSGSDSLAAVWDVLKLRALLNAEPVTDENLLPNPSFEDMAGDQPDGGWSQEVTGGTTQRQLDATGRTGEHCLSISSSDGGHATWSVSVNVEPQTFYRLSGWIKTDEVRPEPQALGAFLNVEEYRNNDRFATRVIEGTSDWFFVQVVFDSINLTSIRINCNFGGWGNAVGTAWFDDLALHKMGRLGPEEEIETFVGPVRQVLFSPGGGELATVSSFETIQTWDLDSLHHLQTFSTGNTTPSELFVRWSPDGGGLAAADVNGKVLFWDLRTNERRESTGPGSVVGPRVLEWLDEKALLAAEPDGMVVSHSTDPEQQETAFLTPRKHLGLAVRADGHCHQGSDDPEQVVYAVRRSDGASQALTIQQFADGFGWKNNPRALASPIGGSSAPTPTPGRLVLGDQPSRSLSHVDIVRSVAFSSDGTTLAAACQDGSVQLWDATTGQEQARLVGHTGAVHSVAFAPQGAEIASAGNDRIIRIWGTAKGQPVASFSGHQAAVNCVAYSPDGKTIATASGDLTVKLWDVATRRVRLTMVGHYGDVCGLAFSQDGTLLASAGLDQAIKVWEVASGVCQRTLHGHREGVVALGFSFDNKMLASGGLREGKLWDVASGRDLAILHHQGQRVHSVAFAPDGRTLVSGGQDGILRLWEIASSQEMDTRVVNEEILSVAISADGKLVATSAGKVVKVWEMHRQATETEN